MELNIGDESTVNDVQMQFNAEYPFLQLQFLMSMQADNKNIARMTKAVPELQMKKLKPLQVPVYISIENEVTVRQLLKNFSEIGLLAQVRRKSVNQWVETSLTDDWTLQRQNDEAMLISIPIEKIP